MIDHQAWMPGAQNCRPEKRSPIHPQERGRKQAWAEATWGLADLHCPGDQPFCRGAHCRGPGGSPTNEIPNMKPLEAGHCTRRGNLKPCHLQCRRKHRPRQRSSEAIRSSPQTRNHTISLRMSGVADLISYMHIHAPDHPRLTGPDVSRHM